MRKRNCLFRLEQVKSCPSLNSKHLRKLVLQYSKHPTSWADFAALLSMNSKGDHFLVKKCYGLRSVALK